jgi:protein-arginine kinase activator protein McsA
MLRKFSCDNHDKGDDYVLTRNQILEICVQLNDSKKILFFPKLIEESELDDLKSRLDKALKDEEYEEAAKLRDKIKEIS